MLGKRERRRGGQQRTGWLNGNRLNRHEFEQASGDGEGQGNLACCSPWGCKESDTTERLNINRYFKLSPSLTTGNFHINTQPILVNQNLQQHKEPMRGGMASSSLHSPPLPTASGCWGCTLSAICHHTCLSPFPQERSFFVTVSQPELGRQR